MHILVKYASRSRPGRFLEGLHSIIDLAANKDNLTVCCVLDKDDHSMQDPAIFDCEGNKFKRVWADYGSSRSKIHAINRPIETEEPWDILVNFSDDMRFTVYGWDELIREGFRCNGSDKFLHYPDSTAKNALATMSIMDRIYYDRDGYIYHPSYQSLWCDNEAMEVAKRRGCYVYMGVQIFEHYHPAYGMVPWDEQYERQQKFWGEDELNYRYRLSNNFFLNDKTVHINTND